MNYMLPGDWVYSTSQNEIGVVKSSGDDKTFVWFDDSDILVIINNDDLKMMARPSYTHDYGNRHLIPHLAERRERLLTNGEQIELIKDSDIRPEIQRKYASL